MICICVSVFGEKWRAAVGSKAETLSLAKWDGDESFSAERHVWIALQLSDANDGPCFRLFVFCRTALLK